MPTLLPLVANRLCVALQQRTVYPIIINQRKATVVIIIIVIAGGKSNHVGYMLE